MKTDKASAISSAAGVANQIPFTSKSNGSTTMVISINTNDLENARTADTIPLDNAVNVPLAKILNPIKNNAIVHILFPVTAKSCTGLFGRANTDTNDLVDTKEAVTVITEINEITFKLMATSSFSFLWFCSP